MASDNAVKMMSKKERKEIRMRIAALDEDKSPVDFVKGFPQSTPVKSRGCSTKFQDAYPGAAPFDTEVDSHDKFREPKGNTPPPITPGVTGPLSHKPDTDAFMRQYGKPVHATTPSCSDPVMTDMGAAKPILASRVDITVVRPGKKGGDKKRCKRLQSVKTHNARKEARSNLSYSGGELGCFLDCKRREKQTRTRRTLQTKPGKSVDARSRHALLPAMTGSVKHSMDQRTPVLQFLEQVAPLNPPSWRL